MSLKYQCIALYYSFDNKINDQSRRVCMQKQCKHDFVLELGWFSFVQLIMMTRVENNVKCERWIDYLKKKKNKDKYVCGYAIQMGARS